MNNFINFLDKEIKNIKKAGLYKNERIIESPQGSEIITIGTEENLDFCQDHPNNCSYNGKIDGVVVNKQTIKC